MGHPQSGGPFVFGAHWGPISGPTLGPWDPFGEARWGALGPIWEGAPGKPNADIMEAEGHVNGGLGAEPPGKLALTVEQKQLSMQSVPAILIDGVAC